MATNDIVQKLWNLCNVLRDDGITYHQYVTELTYILFLKMMKETSQEDKIPEMFRWDSLISKDGINLMNHYKNLLKELGENEGKIKFIYNKAVTNIDEPRNLEKIIREIDKLDWYSAKVEGLGDLYEGLLEKNANEKKSGAGQYFTPRVLIDVIVNIVKPQPNETVNDPACGTFGFLIAADNYLKKETDFYFNLTEAQQEFQKNKAFTGCELVLETHRLALMNAMLHDIQSDIICGDTLSSLGKDLNNYDVVLSNPPFGTKKGGERPTRDDLTFLTSNKQLNFLQHIYNSLKDNGKARAGVVLPDNVLFQDGDGQKIRKDLLEKCNVHTILRLPTGIFYAQGVKTNVLFFTKGIKTSEVWFYDLRTNMQNFGVTNPLKREHFKDFEETFNTHSTQRWKKYTIEEIISKNYSLDLGLMKDDSIVDNDDLPNPVESAENAIAKLEQASYLLQSIIKELRLNGIE